MHQVPKDHQINLVLPTMYIVLWVVSEQINELVTNAPVDDGIEALFSMVVFLGEKVLQQKEESCMLKQELKVINTQHQIDCTLVPKAGSENHGR